MPHQKINHPRRYVSPVLDPDSRSDGWDENGVARRQLVVAWNEIGWASISIFPEGWSDTGDAEIVGLNPQELSLLIKTLRRARRQAYGKGNRWHGYEDGPKAKAEPLWPDRPEL